jgi:hypothetical protein
VRERRMPESMQHLSKFGIYLNASEGKVVRINSPYWLPEEPDWVFLTPEVNATLLQIRELACEQGASSDPDSIVWGRIPLLD